MTDQENLPAKALPRDLAVPMEQGGSLVARGLAAVLQMGKQQLALPAEVDVESLFRQGMRYRYGEGGTQVDDAKAREYFTAASKQDHAEAQYELAYLLGEFEKQEESDQWMQRSADLGFGPALACLVLWSDDLTDEEHDKLFLKAREWYLPRVMAGDAKWQFEYADMLLRQFSQDNREEGLRWLKASAEQNNRRACSRLGHNYLRSDVTEDSTKQGIYWLSHAADLGDIRACRDLGELYLHGHFDSDANNQGRKPHLRIEPDKKIAISWYERAIELGDRGTACKLGTYYLEGKLLDQDLQLAEKWLLRSANDGYDSAQVWLGTEYASGARLRQDTGAAIHWLELAAEHMKSAGLRLAAIYLDGEKIPDNFDWAIKWLTRAANGGTFRNDAMKMVAEKCFDGRFNAAEESAAQSWLAQMAAMTLESVADVEQPQVKHNALHLAELYELGLGVEQDREKAIYWYKQSAKLGLYGAQKRLQELGVDWKLA